MAWDGMTQVPARRHRAENVILWQSLAIGHLLSLPCIVPAASRDSSLFSASPLSIPLVLKCAQRSYLTPILSCECLIIALSIMCESGVTKDEWPMEC